MTSLHPAAIRHPFAILGLAAAALLVASAPAQINRITEDEINTPAKINALFTAGAFREAPTYDTATDLDSGVLSIAWGTHIDNATVTGAIDLGSAFTGTPENGDLVIVTFGLSGAPITLDHPTAYRSGAGSGTTDQITYDTDGQHWAVFEYVNGRIILSDSSTDVDVQNAFRTLADGATVTVACDPSWPIQRDTVTLGGARTLAFTGLANGMEGVLVVKQDATGGRTLALPASAKVVNGGAGAVTLTSAANAIDILAWVYDGTNLYITFGANFN